MKEKKNIIMIGVAIGIVAIIAIFFGGRFAYKKYQENILREEAATLTKKDITKDNFNTEIKSKGDYAVVEKAMKEYLADYGTAAKKTLVILNDKKLSNLLSAETIKSDMPKFEETKKYLEKTRKELDTYMGSMITMTSDKAMMDKIKKTKVSTYYQNLYRELMLDSSLSSSLKEAQSELVASREKMTKLFDIYDNVFQFLIDNEGNYELSGRMLLFKNQSLLSQYNSYINQIRRAAF
ncbi:MAG: hypothetical protein KH135_04855 [Firmicutes bacterium]|nr:hypothetical protein [Bacillota bacterium]